MMMLKKFFALLGFLLAISLIGYGFSIIPSQDLPKAIALSFGFSLLFLIFYPKIRGVKKGDEVVVVTHSFMPSFLGRKGKVEKIEKDHVIVKLDEDGKEIAGIVESNEGLLTPPRVRVIYEERIIK
jgi:membrane protein implicated in regulation of membrane protease activity